MLTLDAPVAKKTTRKATVKADDPRKGVVAHIRGSDAFKDWLDRFAKFKRRNVATLFEDLVVEAAEKAGFERPPER